MSCPVHVTGGGRVVENDEFIGSALTVDDGPPVLYGS
jgi:hypothetical protein